MFAGETVAVARSFYPPERKLSHKESSLLAHFAKEDRQKLSSSPG